MCSYCLIKSSGDEWDFYHTILTPHFGALCAATLQVAERLQLSKHFAAFITAFFGFAPAINNNRTMGNYAARKMENNKRKNEHKKLNCVGGTAFAFEFNCRDSHSVSVRVSMIRRF